jgi:hypothetical protein
VPAAQCVHAVDSGEAEKEPGGQPPQEAAPAELMKPTGQVTHASAEVLSVFPFALPSAHSAQTERPMLDAYRPTAQGAHEPAPEASLCLPRAHGEHSEEPSGAYVPGAHATQSSALSPRTSGFAEPAGQGTHDTD